MQKLIRGDRETALSSCISPPHPQEPGATSVRKALGQIQGNRCVLWVFIKSVRPLLGSCYRMKEDGSLGCSYDPPFPQCVFLHALWPLAGRKIHIGPAGHSFF